MSDKARLFPHYFKATEHLDEVDVYRVLKLFDPQDPSTALGHAVKKILLPGSRGSKGRKQDIEEAIVSLQRYLELEKEDTPRASHEKATPITHDREYVISNKPSLKGGDTSRPSDDPTKGLTLKEFLDACEMQSAMDTELFTMPTGLGIEGMRKFIKECARSRADYSTDELVNQLKRMAVADFEKSCSAAVEQPYKMDELKQHSRRLLALIDRIMR